MILTLKPEAILGGFYIVQTLWFAKDFHLQEGPLNSNIKVFMRWRVERYRFFQTVLRASYHIKIWATNDNNTRNLPDPLEHGMMQYIGPNHEVIDYLAERIGKRWKVFAGLLGLQFYEIDNIYVNENYNVKERVRKVLSMKAEDSLHWNIIERALLYMGEHTLINNLKKQYKELTEGDCQMESPTWTFLLSRVCPLVAPFVKKLARKLEVDSSSYEVTYDMAHNESLVFELFYEKYKTCVDFNWEMLAKAIMKCERKDLISVIGKEKEFADYTHKYEATESAKKIDICKGSQPEHSTWLFDQKICIIYKPLGDSLQKKLLEIQSALGILEQNVEFVGIVCGDSFVSMTVASWNETFCANYYERFLKNFDFLAFNMDDNEDEDINNFKYYLKKTQGNFIIRNYDLHGHYLFLKLQEQISHSDFEREESSHKIDYIGFEGKKRTMFFVKFSEGKSLEHIKKDLTAISLFVAMFIALHMKILQGYGITFLSIVVISNEFEQLKEKIQKECEHCNSLVLTKKQFASFQSNITHLEKRKNKRIKEIRKIGFSVQKFRFEMRGIFGYMAKEKANLVPHFVDDFSEELDEFMISLYPQQLACSTSTDKRVVLQGGHGSGKTIVGKLQVKQLAYESPEDIVYFINCGLSEELTLNMKKYIASIGNLKNIICCSLSSFQDQNSLSGVLREISEKHQNVNKIHVVFDELPLDDITEDIIYSFLEVLYSPKYENSTVYLICQAMTKERIIKEANLNLHTSFRNQVEHLMIEGFKLKTLEKSVRYTLAIKKLVEEIAACLSKMVNRFNTPLVQNANVNSKAEKRSRTEIQRVNATERNAGANEEPSSSINAGSNISSSESETNESGIFRERDTGQDERPNLQWSLSSIDSSLKKLVPSKELNADEDPNNRILESNFKYCICKEEGHNIDGNTPFYYNIPTITNICDAVQMLVACINHSISDEGASIDCKDCVVIIHFEDKIPPILSSALAVLKGDSAKPDFYIKYILDVYGLEYQNVIIYIDSQEYHMRHYLIEAITRCKCNLAVIVANADPTEESVISAMFDRCSIGEGYRDNLVVKVGEDSISEFLHEVQKYDISKFLIETESENQISHSKLRNQVEHLMNVGFKLKTVEKPAIEKLAEEVAACLSKMVNKFNTPLVQNANVNSKAEKRSQTEIQEVNATERNTGANEEPSSSKRKRKRSSESETNESGIFSERDKLVSNKDTGQGERLNFQLFLSSIDSSLKKLVPSKELNADEDPNNMILESNFQYYFCKEEGHNIEGNTPFYYNIQTITNICDAVQMLVACINHFISDEGASIDCKDCVVIFHFKDKIPAILSSALALLKGDSEKPDFCIKYILDVHGLEYKNVIIYFDSQEYHMRHYLIEAITRCKCNLAIIVVNADPTKESAISAMFDKFSNGEGYMDNIITKVDKESISVFLNEVKEYDVRKFLIETESENQSSHNESREKRN